MIDAQGLPDARGIDLPDVGIRGLRHQALTGDAADQQVVVAELALGVRVPAGAKGTHMSRLVEIVQEHSDDLTVPRLPIVLKRLLAHLDSDSGRVEVRFPLVLPQTSPVSRRPGSSVHDAILCAWQENDILALSARVHVVATSLCPCSKLISDYGAHNQRSRIEVTVTTLGEDAASRAPWLRDMVHWAEASASCPTYPLLKRPDERAVTMQAYDKPAFVEDIARDVVVALAVVEGPGYYSVDVVNEESIHRHDAYARVEGRLY